MNGGIPLRKGMNQFEGFVGRRGYVPDGSVTQAHEMFVDSTAEHLEQGVVVAAGVEQDDGMKVEAQLFPRNGFQQFFQRAAAAGQGDDSVGEGEHRTLAFVHVGHDAQFGQAGVLPSPFYHETGYDSGDLASGSQGGIAHGGHEAHAAGAIDHADAAAAQQSAQAARVVRVSEVYLGA